MLFGKLGNVEDAEIIYNDKGSKGFGFVTMSRGQDADNALLRLNHAVVEGRIIEVRPVGAAVVSCHSDVVCSGQSRHSEGEHSPPGS